MFMSRALCKILRKSLLVEMEAPCMSPKLSELLRLNYVFISGGRSSNDELLITFPDNSTDSQIDECEHKELLEYLLQVTNAKEAKFTIVIDRRKGSWSCIKDLIKRVFEVFPEGRLVENVYVLRPTGFFNSLQKLHYEWSTSGDVHSKVKILGSVDELCHFIDPLQLTHDLGGRLLYNSDEWFKHHQLVELLKQRCMQLTEDLKAFRLRMCHAHLSKMTAGQLETEIANLDQEQKQMDSRIENILAEAGAEIVLLKTIDGENLSSAQLPPSSAQHVKLVESLIGKVNDAKTEYFKEYEEFRASLARSLKLRQFEEENNKWCAVLDEHLLFLMNFTPIGDTADDVRKYSQELEHFDEKAKDDVCKSDEFYRNWQTFLSDGLDVTTDSPEESKNDEDDLSSTHDNRIAISCVRYRELMSDHREQIARCLQLHSRIEQATGWYKKGQELLSKSVPEESKANKSALEEAVADIDGFLHSVNLSNLTGPEFADVMTMLTKDVVHALCSSLENLLSECNEKRQKLRNMIINCSKKAKINSAAAVTSTPPAPATPTATTVTTELIATNATPVATDSNSTLCTSFSLAVTKDSSTSDIDEELYLSSKMKREFSHLKPVTATGTIRRKRGHVIQELVATERIYTMELQSIIEGYLKQFDNPELQDMIPDELRQKRSVLFGNIEDIYNFHSTVFLKCLENCAPTEVGKCFSDYKTKFEMYGIYCQNKMQAEHVVEQMGKSPFLVECQRRLGQRLPLSSYILKPIQRITKYHLLLRELIKMATSQQEKDDLIKAVESMRDVVKYVNNILHQVSITGFDGNLSEQGRLLMQGSVDVGLGKRRDKKGDVRLKVHRRHVFLYEKCIIFCKKKEESQMNEKAVYVYKNCLKMDDIGLTETPKSGDERRFELWCQGRTDVWTIITPSEEIKDEWIKEIKRLLFSQYRHIKETKRMSQIGRQGTPDSAEFKQPSLTQT